MTAAVWDQQAATLDDAWCAVWADADQPCGIAHCLDMLAPALEHLDEGGHILDLGAGIGRLAIPIALDRPTVTVWALDVSPRMLDHLTTRMQDQNAGTVRPVLGDGGSIPDLVPTLDAAFSVVTLQHLPRFDQHRCVSAVAGRLRPGGVFRFQVVTDTGRGPLSHPVDADHVSSWCYGADLAVIDYATDPRFRTWRWITAVKL